MVLKANVNGIEVQGETPEHLKAKADIVHACRRAGYEAATEAPGADWRADVLAARGKTKIAFEVQWSFLNLDECLIRQERYARDGVRGCWFFRRPPPALQRDTHLYGGPPLRARIDLPLFHLVPNMQGVFCVTLNERLYLLDEFVPALLAGRIRFSEQAVAPEFTRVHVVLFELPCAHCGRRNIVFTLDTRVIASCGLTFRAQRSLPQELLWKSEVLDALTQFRRSDEGRLLRIGSFVQRANNYLSQGCADCGEILPMSEVAAEYDRLLRTGREEWLGEFLVNLRIDAAMNARMPHWCYPPAGVAHCCP